MAAVALSSALRDVELEGVNEAVKFILDISSGFAQVCFLVFEFFYV